MAPRKPKAPEKRPKPLIIRLLSTTALWLGFCARGLGRQALSHPGPALASALFLGVFGSVAANALWYQPQRLSSGYFATRDFERFDALPGLRHRQAAPADVTTFKIERAETVIVEGDEPAAATQASAPAPATGDETASIIRQAEALPVAADTPVAGPENVALAVAVQQALIRRGLYNGAADGVIGPRTTAAILFFEQTEGLPETGAVTEDLLKRLTEGAPPAETTAAISAAPAATEAEADPVAAAIRATPVPAARPKARAADPEAHAKPVKVKSGSDDLANLIREADGKGAASAARKPAAPVDAHMIAQIQAGLARMAYQNADPKGVAGPGTRAAIRQFQKYYRLPMNGEPSAEVLAKLKEIGAV